MSSATPDELQARIQGLYRAFSRYKLAPHVPSCDHCTHDSDHTSIRSAPLRQLTADNLSRFAWKAMTTWGSPDDFRHFLPRILELVALGGLGGAADLEVVIGKLTYGEWRSWPPAEQAAVEHFLRAFWRSALAEYPQQLEADTCLCAIAQAEDDLSAYLKGWGISGSRAAACHFADVVQQNPAGSSRKRKPWLPSNAFWADRPVPAGQFKAWLLHPDRLADLERAFFAFAEDPETTTLLSDAFAELANLRIVVSVV